MHPKQKIKFNDWYLKIDPPMWMAADFEGMNVPINDNDNDHVTDKLFVNKPVSKVYKIVKNPDYENLNLGKDGYIITLVKIVLNGSYMRCWKKKVI